MRGDIDVATAMGWEVVTDDGYTTRYYKKPDGERVAGEPTVDDMLDWLRERGVSLRDALGRVVAGYGNT